METYVQLEERERQKKLADFYGKTITAAELRGAEKPGFHNYEDDLLLTFATGEQLRIYDGGQSCCESRYMRTDDDVQSLVGHILLRVTVKEASNLEGVNYGDHEQQFVEVSTTGGLITLVNHNEHNGYYGGFSLCCEAVQ